MSATTQETRYVICFKATKRGRWEAVSGCTFTSIAVAADFAKVEGKDWAHAEIHKVAVEPRDNGFFVSKDFGVVRTIK